MNKRQEEVKLFCCFNINCQGVNKELASARAEKIFEQLDEDGNGELSEEEFCKWDHQMRRGW